MPTASNEFDIFGREGEKEFTRPISVPTMVKCFCKAVAVRGFIVAIVAKLLHSRPGDDSLVGLQD